MMGFDDAYDISVEYFIKHLEEVPEQYFSFPLEYEFSNQDMWRFENKKHVTGLGCNWFLNEDTLYIYRGDRIQYKIKLHLDTGKHRVKYYLYEPFELNYWKNFFPRKELLITLEMFTGHKAVIGK